MTAPCVTITIKCHRLDAHWDVDIEIDGDDYGGGTTPNYPLDLAWDILYGDSTDWLNGSRGVLGDYLASKGLPD